MKDTNSKNPVKTFNNWKEYCENVNLDGVE